MKTPITIAFRSAAWSMAFTLACCSLAGCGKSESPAEVTASNNNASGHAAQQPGKPAEVQACKLITPEEMNAIAGVSVVPTADDGVGRTGCVWQPAAAGMPRIELKIEWGSGEAAMVGLGMLSKHEPGINNPYEGLGDEAVASGPAIMIKRDEDLVTIVLSGVDDAESAVHKIYDTATARL